MRVKQNFTVLRAKIDPLPRRNKPRSYKPRAKVWVPRARFSGTIATICNGRRVIRKYYSGEPLVGYIE